MNMGRQQRESSMTFRNDGLTLVEVLVAIALVGILTTFATVSYNSFITRAALAEPGLGLSVYASQLEQRYADVKSYGAGACGVAAPASSQYKYFDFSCKTTGGGQGFLVTATNRASETLNGAGSYVYTLDHTGVKKTTAFKGGGGIDGCWKISDAAC